MSDADIDTFALPGVALRLDTRHFPVIIATWFGTPNVEVAQRYIEWLDRQAQRAKAQGTKIVLVGDLTTAERPPPEVRRIVARALEKFHVRNGDTFLGGSTVVAHPFMRAMITMVLALTRAPIDFKPVKSIKASFERARALLDAAGVAWPEGLDAETYVRPSDPSSDP